MKVLKTSAIAIILAIALLLAPAAKSPASLELNGHEVTWVNHYASISLQIVPDRQKKRTGHGDNSRNILYLL